MIEEQTVDIFKQTDLDAIAHQANCMCTMGSGIAKTIRLMFPEAYEADCKTTKGALSKLGTYSSAIVNHVGKKDFTIVNLYGQGNFTNRNIGKRDTVYDALYDAMTLLRDTILNRLVDDSHVKIGIPYGMGCALGGGSWKVVYAMIEDIFGDEEFINVVICKLPQ